MTRRLGRGDTQRGRARLTLLVVSLLLGALMVIGGPGGPLNSVFAAVGGTPTSTTTASDAAGSTTTPSPPSTPKIQLINPSKYESTVTVSKKHDADDTYHLVAWVAAPPSDAAVAFKIMKGTEVKETITGTRTCSSCDTWQANWTVTQADDTYDVVAQLTSSSVTAGPDSSDTEAVTVDNDRPSAEITYPTNNGALGVYRPAGQARGFVIDVTTSSDATGVNVFYGTSPPGTEQNWRNCDVQETVFYSDNSKRVGCTVDGGVGTADITAVAAVTTGTVDFDPNTCFPPDNNGPPPTCNSVDSGDAHRVLPYDQTPASVSVVPSSSGAITGSCKELVATVLDSDSRPVWRANVDVHAVGPNDNLQFGTNANTRPYQPPDASGTHTGTEPSNNCGSGTAPAQGYHDAPNASDTKHVETVPADDDEGGADTSGGFRFALRSPQDGTTSIEAWADINDNDLRDTSGTAEPQGLSALQWSANGSGSPPPSASPTPTATASSSPSPTPAARSISLNAPSSAKYGKSVLLSGAITSAQTSCVSGQTVTIERTIDGTSFADFGTATSDSSGAYSFTFTADSNASYRATLDATSSCSAATSETRSVLVSVDVSINPSKNRVQKGKFVSFHIHVNPCGSHAGTNVTLLRNTGRGYREVGTAKLNANCNATIQKRVRRTARYKASWPSQDDDHETGTSGSERVRATRR